MQDTLGKKFLLTNLYTCGVNSFIDLEHPQEHHYQGFQNWYTPANI